MSVLYYPRTISVSMLLILLAGFSLSDLRIDTWHLLLGPFQWLETTWVSQIGRTWGAAFATIEAFHLLGLALLGGSILVSDGHLLGLWLADQPGQSLQAQAHKVFTLALILLIMTGIFMACVVAVKIYYMEVYWYKMLALVSGILFVYGIKRPLTKRIDTTNPWLLRSVAVSSLMIWFTVAASGRWIGFS